MIHESLGASATEIAERLALLPRPDGGWRRASSAHPGPIGSDLLLEVGGIAARWRRSATSTAWFWHAGASAQLEVFDPGAPTVRHRLGIDDGASPQAFVPAYAWWRVTVTEGWCLLGTARATGEGAPSDDASLVDVAPAEWSPGDRDPRFSSLLERSISDLGADSGSVHLLLDDGLLHLVCAKGIPDPVLAIVHRVPVGKGMAGLAVQRRGPVTACNIQTDRSGDVRPGARATGLEGAIVVPIVDERDGAIGALGVANRAARTFTPQETVRLVDLGREIARARLGR